MEQKYPAYPNIKQATSILVDFSFIHFIIYSPPSPLVETISGRKVNIFDKSDISLLGRNAAKIDMLLEHGGMFLLGEKRLKGDIEHQQIKQKYEDAVRNKPNLKNM